MQKHTLSALCAGTGGNGISWDTSTPRDVSSANWAAPLTSLCMLVPHPSYPSHLPPGQHSLCAELSSHSLWGYWQQCPGIPRGAAVGRLPVAWLTVCFGGVQVPPPVPRQGKAHFENNSSPGLPPVLLCHPPAAEAVNAGVPGSSGGAAPLAYPQSKATSGIPAPQPLISLSEFL